MEFCQICHEDFPETDVSTVNCRSTVAHKLCHFCEGEWRSKMPLQENGMRGMNCPTCRAPEDPEARTKESLQREVIRLNRLLAETTATATVEIRAEISADDEAFLQAIFEDMGFEEMDFTPDFTPPSSAVRASRPRSPRIACASGRGRCQSRSRSGVTLTTLKCYFCKVITCCRNCGACVGCIPIPVPIPAY